MYILARKSIVWKQLPMETKIALNSTLALAGAQVTLGITTLLHAAPIDLAATHQAGSLVLLSSVLWTLHSLRFAKKIPLISSNKLKL